MQIDMEAVQRGVIADISQTAWEEGRWLEYIRKDIDARIDVLFAQQVEEVVSAAIKSAVVSGFERTYQPVDAFGKPTGEPTTIRASLQRMVAGYWSERVDKHGRKSDSSYGTMSRAEFTMLSICGEDFSKEFKQHAVNVTASLKDGLRAELRGWVDKTLGELFRVQSADDKAENRRNG